MKKSTAFIYLVLVTLISIYVIATNDRIYSTIESRYKIDVSDCKLQIVDMQAYIDKYAR
jgi:hypothetical protein